MFDLLHWKLSPDRHDPARPTPVGLVRVDEFRMLRRNVVFGR